MKDVENVGVIVRENLIVDMREKYRGHWQHQRRVRKSGWSKQSFFGVAIILERALRGGTFIIDNGAAGENGADSTQQQT